MVTELSTTRGGEAIHHAKWRERIDDLMEDQETPGYEPVLAYGWGEVPGFDLLEDVDGNRLKKPYQHWQIAVSRTYTPDDVPRGLMTRVGWRLETLAVAPTPGEVRAMRDRLHQLRDVRSPFLHGSPLRLEDENEIDRLPGAAGHWGGLSTWIYVTPR